jgi:hypothetical protein
MFWSTNAHLVLYSVSLLFCGIILYCTRKSKSGQPLKKRLNIIYNYILAETLHAFLRLEID